MPLLPSIESFGTEIRGRATNDSKNSDREKALEILFSKDSVVRDQLLRVSPQRKQWEEIRTKCQGAITNFMKVGGNGVEPQVGRLVSAQRKGGRSTNYDFEGLFEVKGGGVVSLRIELKRGESIYDQPQFLQLYAREGEMVTRRTKSYAEFFYTEYLKSVTELAGTPIPGKSEYLQKCCGTNYDVFPHTAVLYERLEKNHLGTKERLKAIAYESIDEYLAILEEDETQVDLVAIQSRLDQQLGKLFLSWDPSKQNFSVEVFSREAMTLTGEITFKRRPSGERSCLVVTNQAGHPIEALLRWKNRSCVLGPAWQISLKAA